MVRIPAYRLHKSSGQGVSTIAGKDYYFGPYRDKASEKKYRTLIAEFLASNSSQSFGIACNQIVWAELAVSYLGFAKNYYAESHEYQNMLSAVKPIRELYSRTTVKGFGPIEFKACRNWWVLGGASRQYANTQAKRLLRIVKWGVSE